MLHHVPIYYFSLVNYCGIYGFYGNDYICFILEKGSHSYSQLDI